MEVFKNVRHCNLLSQLVAEGGGLGGYAPHGENFCMGAENHKGASYDKY